jgi:hypothetical protein
MTPRTPPKPIPAHSQSEHKRGVGSNVTARRNDPAGPPRTNRGDKDGRAAKDVADKQAHQQKEKVAAPHADSNPSASKGIRGTKDRKHTPPPAKRPAQGTQASKGGKVRG